MQSKWYPICETLDELVQNIDKSSNQITVNSKDENIKMKNLSLYFSLIIPNFNNDENNDTIKLRLPSVIQKIPVLTARQYWESVMEYDDRSIIRKACQIPIQIINHVRCLQKQFLKGRESKQLNMHLNEGVDNNNDKCCPVSSMHPVTVNCDYGGDDNSMIKGSFMNKEDLKEKLTSIGVINGSIQLQNPSAFVYLSKNYIFKHFFENDENTTLDEVCDGIESILTSIVNKQCLKMKYTCDSIAENCFLRCWYLVEIYIKRYN